MSIIQPPARAGTTAGTFASGDDSRFSINISQFKGFPDNNSNVSIAINNAVSQGIKQIVFDEGPQPYLLSSPLILSSGVKLIAGKGKPILKISSTVSTSRIFVLSGLFGVEIIGFTIDGSLCPIRNDAVFIINSGANKNLISRNEFINLPGAGTGCIVMSSGAFDNEVSYNRFDNCINTTIGISAAFSNRVLFNRLFDNGDRINHSGFGIRIGEGSHRNKILGNHIERQGIEAIAMYYDCYFNEIIGNHAEACGDNGISVSGYNNTITSNICIDNYGAGIGIWGSTNSIAGNVCNRNGTTNPQALWASGQVISVGDKRINLSRLYTATSAGTTASPGPTHTTGTVADGGGIQWTAGAFITAWSGIWIACGYGGTGQYNVVSGNSCDDEKLIPSQYNDVRIEGSSGYSVWASGQTVTIGDYRVNGLNIYRATTSGTTSVAPTHTTGSITGSDGIAWTYYNTFIAQASPRGNVIIGNTSGRSKTGTPFADAGNWVSNSVIGYGHATFNASGGFGFSLLGLPTSSSGLGTGRLWNNNGVVNVV